jgi:ribosomal protein S25
MSDETPFIKPTNWNLNKIMSAEDMKKKADEAAKNASPEVQQAVEKTSSFVSRYPKEIALGLIALVCLRVYRRKISRATAKQVLKGLEKTGQNANNSDLPNLYKILEDLRVTPEMAYIPHGGGMVHLLGGRDAIVTVFGDFEKMTNEELWSQVASILNLNIRV